MKTAGLASLLLLSLLLIGTDSDETSDQQPDVKTTEKPDSVPEPDIQIIPPSSSQPEKNESRDTDGEIGTEEKPDANAKTNTTQTEPTPNPKISEDLPETRPTDADKVVTSAQGSLPEKESVPSPSSNATGQIPVDVNDLPADPPMNRTDSADLPDTPIDTTEKDGKPQAAEPTMTGPKPNTPKTIVLTSGEPTIKPAAPPVNTGEDKPKESEGSDKQKGQITEPPKQDKKMLWILLPVLGVLVGGVIFVLKKYTKGHTHTDTAENGTENASFQSRSDSNKDGVLLLGVKTSAAEENAAAR